MRKGFTLIEIIMVIIIIAIVAVVAIPKFINLEIYAKVYSDEGVIGAIKSAINIQTINNNLTGTKNSAGYFYPQANPFTLLAQTPPNKPYDSWNPDGVTWQTFNWAEQNVWWMMCPHYQGNPGNTHVKGRLWIYAYGDNGYGHPAGDVWLFVDMGH